jgi:RNA polymerase sigma-70 factor (ECF subfamily)
MDEPKYGFGKDGTDMLFRMIQKGDEIAFEKVFRKFHPRLYNFALKVVKNNEIAEDIIQDIFIKLWEKKEKIKPVNIEGFIFKVLKNQCITHLRNLKIIENARFNLSNMSHIEELYRIDFIRDEPYVLIEQELQLEIDRVLNMLPDRCKEVFVLSRLNGLKNREIAQKLGINIKNVERHITKALTAFRIRFKNKVTFTLIAILLLLLVI